MTNEEFQSIVIESLKELREGQKVLEDRQRALENRQMGFEDKQSVLEKGQKEILQLVKVIYEQTADLTEFKTEVNDKLDIMAEDSEVMKGLIGKHEVDIKVIQKKMEQRTYNSIY